MDNRLDDPVGAARAFVQERYPGALAAFLGGSTARGAGTPTSDLDIVLVLPAPAQVHGENLLWGGWPVELFVHTRESVLGFMEFDRSRGSGTMAFMCASGVVLHDRDGTAEQLRDAARRTLAAGPPAPEPAVLERARYDVTDLRDDLLGANATNDDADADELLAIAATLLERTAGLLFAVRNHWHGGGKWLPRRLREADPELADSLLDGYRTLVRGGPREPFAEAVAAVLDRCGGPLWAGYRRVPDARMLAYLREGADSAADPRLEAQPSDRA
jgi:hypothetical protein